MRALPPAFALSAAAAAVLLSAPAAYSAPPGDDPGVVQIHDAATGAELGHGRPEVCTFALGATGFDGPRRVVWQIVERHPGKSGTTVAETGRLTVGKQGLGHTSELSLADGHYTLRWNLDGERGTAKPTPFRINCDDGDKHSGTRPSHPAASSSAPTGADSDRPGRDPDDGRGEAGPSSSAALPSSEPELTVAPQGETVTRGAVPADDGSDLADTGGDVPMEALATAAASLLGAGAYLLLRRRNTRHHQD